MLHLQFRFSIEWNTELGHLKKKIEKSFAKVHVDFLFS